MRIPEIIDSFTVGGVAGHPSMPGARLQRMLGTRIAINIDRHTLTVPTKNGMVEATTGDRIILYDDGALEVVTK